MKCRKNNLEIHFEDFKKGCSDTWEKIYDALKKLEGVPEHLMFIEKLDIHAEKIYFDALKVLYRHRELFLSLRQFLKTLHRSLNDYLILARTQQMHDRLENLINEKSFNDFLYRRPANNLKKVMNNTLLAAIEERLFKDLRVISDTYSQGRKFIAIRSFEIATSGMKRLKSRDSELKRKNPQIRPSWYWAYHLSGYSSEGIEWIFGSSMCGFSEKTLNRRIPGIHDDLTEYFNPFIDGKEDRGVKEMLISLIPVVEEEKPEEYERIKPVDHNRTNIRVRMEA